MQRYFAIEKKDNKFILGNDDLYHIKTVMRMQDNDEIEVVYLKKVYICCLVNVKLNMEILIKKEVEKKEENLPYVTLIVPLLQENKMDLIMQKATEMGASKIIVIPMNRCKVKADKAKIDKKKSRWIRICKEASEQSKRVDIPEVEFNFDLKKMLNMGGLNLICSTLKCQKNLKMVLTKNKNCDRINLVMGPEGGFTSEEEKFLVENGFEPITLGNRILRVESVPLFLLSALNYEYME